MSSRTGLKVNKTALKQNGKKENFNVGTVH